MLQGIAFEGMGERVAWLHGSAQGPPIGALCRQLIDRTIACAVRSAPRGRFLEATFGERHIRVKPPRGNGRVSPVSGAGRANAPVMPTLLVPQRRRTAGCPLRQSPARSAKRPFPIRTESPVWWPAILVEIVHAAARARFIEQERNKDTVKEFERIKLTKLTSKGG